MNQKTIKSLEFDKIMQMLVNESSNEITRLKIQKMQPETDLESIQYQQAVVKESYVLLAEKQYPSLGHFKDVSGALKRADIGGILNTVELINVGNVFRIARSLSTFYKDDKRGSLRLDSLFDMLCVNKKVENAIFEAVIDEDEIADSASAALSTIRRQMAGAHNRIKEALNRLIHNSSHQKHLQEAIVTIRNGRYVVPVKAEYRSEIGGIVHDMSATGSTLFIEPNAVVEINNNIRELEMKEQAEIERILAELTQLVSEVHDELSSNQKSISEIDFIFTKAKLAERMDAVSPKINKNGFINIIKGRHPLLDPKRVVPISISIGGELKTMVITGPNTGGKTVTLKTVGLFSMMVAAGLMIPAANGSEISIFDHIFADIGDEQSIEQNLSTFSAHMSNIISILNHINSSTLVLYDELGAGTDPVEGAALAVAILEYSKASGAITMATTHYSELKIYALTTEGVENAGCEFDVNSLRPTYRLLVGTPGKSNAFAISKRLGLSDEIIGKANQLLTEENVRFEDVLENLEKSRQEAEKEREAANNYLTEIERLKKQLELDKEKIEEQKEKLLLNARQEAKKIVQNAKIEVNAIIDEIKEAQKTQEKNKTNKAIEEARGKIRKMDQPIIKLYKDESQPPKTVIPGNSVKIVDIDQTGTVMTKPDSSNMVVVQVGILKINSHLSNLRLAQNNKPKKPDSYIKNRSGGLKLESVKTELDLRGCTLDEAILLSERFIDGAVVASLEKITIIHGKGTGVLRTGIHKMLKTHPNVKEYRLGEYGEGDSGITVITLKSRR